MTDLRQRIAMLTPEQRARLENRLLTKKAAAAEEAPIPRRGNSEPCALSFCQQRLWFLDELAPGTSTYNVPNAMRIRGPLNVGALRQSLETLVQRHEVLRTVFTSVKGNPLQVILTDFQVDFAQFDVSHHPSEQRESLALEILQEQARRPFDLAKDLKIRSVLVRLDQHDHMLLISTHHIAWDAWSKVVAYREVAAIYTALISGAEPELKDPTIQYADYALWQRAWIQGDIYKKQAAYWKQQLGNAAHVLELPIDKKRPAVQNTCGAKYFFAMSKTLAEAAKAMSRERGVTLYMVLMAAFKAFLFGFTGQEDISLGSPIAGRNRPELEGLIGFFINTLVYRTELSGNPTFYELLGRVRETTLGAYANQDLPFDKLVELIQPPRDLSRMALFQVNFRVAGTAPPQLQLPGLDIAPLELIDTATSKFDLALELAPNTELPASYWEYNSDLFEESTIERLCQEFEEVLAAVLSQPDTPLGSLKSIEDLLRRKRAMDAKPKMKSLKDIKRRAIDLSQVSMVNAHPLRPDHDFPLMIEPAVENVDLAEWARNNSSQVESYLYKHGAIVFRGFNLKSPTDFEAAASGICSELFGEYGDLPRAGVAGKIYQSTPYPNDKMILFHNESSHLSKFPMKINFFCVKAAPKGGCTPIVDCREVARRLDPTIRKNFAEKGLMYVRNFAEGLDVSWRSFFHTDDRSVVEKACHDAGMTCEWTKNDGLRVRQVCQAIAKHPRTGEDTFFNQVQLHHIFCLDSATRDSLLSIFKEEDLPRHVYYGDGTPIENSTMEHVGEVYEACAVRFQWHEGDMVTLDNLLTAHARDPFEGERKICVAMGQMITAADLGFKPMAAATSN